MERQEPSATEKDEDDDEEEEEDEDDELEERSEKNQSRTQSRVSPAPTQTVRSCRLFLMGKAPKAKNGFVYHVSPEGSQTTNQ